VAQAVNNSDIEKTLPRAIANLNQAASEVSSTHSKLQETLSSVDAVLDQMSSVLKPFAWVASFITSSIGMVYS